MNELRFSLTTCSIFISSKSWVTNHFLFVIVISAQVFFFLDNFGYVIVFGKLKMQKNGNENRKKELHLHIDWAVVVAVVTSYRWFCQNIWMINRDLVCALRVMEISYALLGTEWGVFCPPRISALGIWSAFFGSQAKDSDESLSKTSSIFHFVWVSLQTVFFSVHGESRAVFFLAFLGGGGEEEGNYVLIGVANVLGWNWSIAAIFFLGTNSEWLYGV